MKDRIIVENQSQPTLPVVGRVRIGEKRISEKTGKEYPVSLDYFRVTGKYESFFYDAFGTEKVSKIPIIFISDDGFSCNELKILRDSKGKKYGISDGEEYSIWNPEKKLFQTFFKKDIADIEERTAKKTGTEWMSTLTLRFIIPKIRGILGVWQFETRGVASSIKLIKGTFDTVLRQAGTVKKVMFDLTVEKVKSDRPDNPSVYPVVSLICNISDENLAQLKEYFESGVTNSMRYITDETLQQLGTKMKQLPENIEIVEGAKIEVVKDTNLFNY